MFWGVLGTFNFWVKGGAKIGRVIRGANENGLSIFLDYLGAKKYVV